MFYDLNVRLSKTSASNNFLAETLSQLLYLGYEGVALTTEVNESSFAQKKDKGKKRAASDGDPVPPPPRTESLTEKFPKLKLYKRINVVLSESENIQKVLQSKNLRRYDLISFQPETQSVLKSLTGVSDVNIISYNPESRCSLSLGRKLYNRFVNQNVFFELTYVPAISSQSARRNLISLSHVYHAIGKCKNIIVSSGTHLPTYVRGPYDVINFNLLFGLSEEQAKRAITRNCENVLLVARNQRNGKGVIEVVSCNIAQEQKSTDGDVKMEVAEE